MPLPFYTRLAPSRSHIRHLRAPLTVAVGGALMSACAHTPPRTADVGQPCAGRRMLVVHNHTDIAVDVYAYSLGAAREFLGTANPGDHELYLGRATEPFVAKAAGGKQIVVATGSQEPHVMDRITSDTSCRSV